MNSKKITLFACLLCSVILAFGQQEANTHDGFFLNLSLGASFGKSNVETTSNNVSDDYNYDLTGSGLALDLLIGGAPVENLAIHATLAVASLIEPEVDGTEFGNPVNYTAQDISLNTEFFGVGATFYTADNLFFSPNLGISKINITDDDGSEISDSDRGFGFLLRAGKEWWVGDQWGLGFALSYRGALGSTDIEPDLEEDWSSNNFSVSFSATFN
ncbi:MAG: hypothetical protein GDA51_09960 [Ekhidna sp.]|nr:hypothetical protein [Ekhidna sp.]MBC6426769.1 hypothetical protein [Ekhidna sp.]